MDTVQAILIQLLSEETKMEDQRDHYQRNQLYQKKLGDTLPSLVSDAQCQVYITGTNIQYIVYSLFWALSGTFTFKPIK